ncbi:hypothetical protein GE061_015418 [Apolygus lucorum]|uniref:Lipase domain-containing protein n=1 Tax=Apolygus lucorum TaxID=248454 RepID=A0A8S9XM12_APOLU|nr:hypothetical protein GE061_015418 [Apolygus lucorum]
MIRTAAAVFTAFVVANATFRGKTPFNQYKEMMDMYMSYELQLFRQPPTKIIDNGKVIFVLYKKVNGVMFRSVERKRHNGSLHKGLFDCKIPLKVGIHGWQQTMKSLFVRKMKEAYLKSMNSIQIVIVRWFGADNNYPAAKMSIPEVARVVYRYLKRLTEESCIQFQDITLIGHSLGAQLAGAIGNLANGSIGNMVALEPANPTFFAETLTSVSAVSARWVIGVHTNPGYYGVDYNVGHVDFWINMGESPQPSCLRAYSGNTNTYEKFSAFRGQSTQNFHYADPIVMQLACSHEKAIHLFFESVQHPLEYVSQECICTHTSHCVFPNHGVVSMVFFNEMIRTFGQFCFFTS